MQLIVMKQLRCVRNVMIDSKKENKQLEFEVNEHQSMTKEDLNNLYKIQLHKYNFLTRLIG